jgi:hypothetical protein
VPRHQFVLGVATALAVTVVTTTTPESEMVNSRACHSAPQRNRAAVSERLPGGRSRQGLGPRIGSARGSCRRRLVNSLRPLSLQEPRQSD